MNKGLELIEAHYLFGIPESRIEILVHPESVVHSLVGYADGSVLAQLGAPDMRTPIACALAWPGRMTAPVSPLDLVSLGKLTFEAPDKSKFPALDIALQVLQTGGAARTILNAAYEVALHEFMGGGIGFLDIVRTVEATLANTPTTRLNTLDDIFDIDVNARRVAEMYAVRV